MARQNILFGVSTWLWESPFDAQTVRLFPKIKEMGFDSVEIPVEDPNLIDAKELKLALEDSGLVPTVCGAFGPTKDFTHEDPLVHQNCFDYIQRCLDLCNELQVDFLAGPMYSAVGKARMVSQDQRRREWDMAVKNLHKVCVMAESQGLVIALEPLNRFETDLINTVDDVMRLIHDIDHPAARILLDGFHMTIEESNLKKAIRTAGDRLVHVQVSENHRGVPGTGLTPWTDFARGLKDINYQGVITIESFTPENKELVEAVCIWKNLADNQDDFARDGLKFLRKIFS